MNFKDGKVLLIGYGNSLRSDDGLGPLAARMLAERLDGEAVDVITAQQLLPEFAEAISQARRVIFIDASAVGPAGEIMIREVQAQSGGQDWLIHDFTPQMLLAYAQQLYDHAPRAILITVNGFSFDHGDQLSPSMKELLPQLLQQIGDQF